MDLSYALSLHFDSSSRKEISFLQSSLASLTGNSYLADHQVPPHLTLGIFHIPPEELEKAENLFDRALADFSKVTFEDQKDFTISFSQIDNFKERVIFLSPDQKCPGYGLIKNLNKLIFSLFSPCFAPGANGNYRPENFFPHLALAVKLTKPQFLAAQGIGSPRQRSGGNEMTGRMERMRKAGKPGGLLSPCAQNITLPLTFKIDSLSFARCHPYEVLLERAFECGR